MKSSSKNGSATLYKNFLSIYHFLSVAKNGSLIKLSLSLYCFLSVKFSWVCYALQKLSFLPTVFDQRSSHHRNGVAMLCKKLSFSLPFLISEVLIKKCVCYALQKNSCFRKTWVLKNPYTWCKSCIEIWCSFL